MCLLPQIKAFLSLVGALVQLQSSPVANDPRRNPHIPVPDANVSAEIVRTMRELGMMHALTGMCMLHALMGMCVCLYSDVCLCPSFPSSTAS